jgi:S-formylglutathione hydrolase FrmB
MALIRCDYFSEVLEVGTTMTVLLPQATEEQVGVSAGARPGDPPLLYLLHGLSDDATAWQRYTGIERYAAEHGLAVVMPQVGRSFYADEVHGARYWTHLTEELPEVVSSFFRVSQRREDTFVAGLSMGGYGALKWAMHQPERFAAVASLSGAVDVRKLLPQRPEIFQRVFDGTLGPDDVLEELLQRHAAADVPPVYIGCGTDDALYEENVHFADRATAAGLDVRTDFRAGAHEWGVWDLTIAEVLAWLPLAGARH